MTSGCDPDSGPVTGGAEKLSARHIEKPWGRTDLPAMFASSSDSKIGEIWFEVPAGEQLPLLVKYLFSSDSLSIQVHPGDQEARARGFPRGKNECWYVIDAAADATIGLGLVRPVSKEQLRTAALDGSIEKLLNWTKVAVGDFIYVPAGTVHAVRGHMALLEVGQSADATYRLYDYGRQRRLHVDEGISVAVPGPASVGVKRTALADGFEVLLSAHSFSVVWTASSSQLSAALLHRRRWVMPLSGQVYAHDAQAGAGECLLVSAGVHLTFGEGAEALIAIEGPL